jgi:hypothetical protein
MIWNYRVMKRGDEYAIYEVFYNEDGTVRGHTAAPVHPRAGSPEDLAAEMTRYAAALEKPALQYEG